MENKMETTIINWVNIGINGKFEAIMIRFPKPKIQLPSTPYPFSGPFPNCRRLCSRLEGAQPILHRFATELRGLVHSQVLAFELFFFSL